METGNRHQPQEEVMTGKRLWIKISLEPFDSLNATK
jgi:hypothetical protein